MKYLSASEKAIGAEVSIIVPCYNEKNNVLPLFRALETALVGWRWEAIYVDDNSPDGTIEEIRKLARQDIRARGILRVNKRGLSSAVIDGVLSSSADYIAVIDGDMQHDETRLPDMLEAVIHRNFDFAVGSRHVSGGSNQGLANYWRRFLSDRGIALSQKILPVPLKDPMSGFFVLKRKLFLNLMPTLTGTGFKILLDLILSCPSTIRVIEIPFQFRKRFSGLSKLGFVIMMQFIVMLLQKKLKRYPR